MTRAQLVAEIGEAAVAKLEAGAWEPTSRVLPHSGHQEWSTYIMLDVDGCRCIATAYVELADEQITEDMGDLPADAWTPERYTLA